MEFIGLDVWPSQESGHKGSFKKFTPDLEKAWEAALGDPTGNQPALLTYGTEKELVSDRNRLSGRTKREKLTLKTRITKAVDSATGKWELRFSLTDPNAPEVESEAVKTAAEILEHLGSLGE